jgi:hypothetical protein
MSSSNRGGGAPTVLWDVLKGKEVKTNDGKDLGEIKEFSQGYVRVEKGTIKKESFWLPKYIADAYDGKTLWLLLGEQEVRERYQFGEKEGEFMEAPTTDQYTTDLDTFKSTTAGKKREYPSDLEESIRLVEDYDNIRKI